MKKIIFLLSIAYFIGCTPSSIVTQQPDQSIVHRNELRDTAHEIRSSISVNGNVVTVKGEKGEKGNDGQSIVGPQGPAGRDGKDGVGVKGEKGDRGNDGNVSSATLTDEQLAKIIASIKIPAVLIGVKSLRDFGAIPDDDIDDADATQTAVDYYINHAYSWLTFERGKYLWGHKVKLEVPNGFVFLSLRGDGNSFDPENNKGAGTLIKLTNKMDYAIGIEGGKGCRVDDFNIQGMNTGLSNYSYADVVSEKNDFNPDGCLDTKHALHAAIIIDPDYRANKSGSTGIKGSNIYMSSFIGGVIISPNGTQNGEDCVFTNIWADHMKVCFSSGDAQNRTNYVIHFTNWGVTKTSFSSADYGTGCPFIVQGANFAGGSKEIYHTGQWYGNAEHGSDFHAEEMYRIQRGSANDGVVVLDECNIDLMGEHEGVRLPSQIVQCRSFIMNGGRLVYYGKNQSIIALSVMHAEFNHTKINCPFIALNGDVKYNNVDMGFEKNINEPPLVGTSATATKVVSIKDDVWTFESSNKINVGDYVTVWKNGIKSEFENGNPLTIGAGVVQSIDSGTIRVKGVPYGIVEGQDLDISTYRIVNKTAPTLRRKTPVKHKKITHK